MPLVLALEPDPKQAAVIRQIVRDRVGAEFVLADSKDVALAVLADRVPDLILVTALLSPRDESDLTDHLRDLEGAEHLQTLTIPLLIQAPAAAPKKKKRGLLSALTGDNDKAPPMTSGCDPSVFAKEIADYIARAEEHRTEAAAQRARETRKPRKKARGHTPVAEAAPTTTSSSSYWDWDTPSAPATAPASSSSAPSAAPEQDSSEQTTQAAGYSSWANPWDVSDQPIVEPAPPLAPGVEASAPVPAREPIIDAAGFEPVADVAIFQPAADVAALEPDADVAALEPAADVVADPPLPEIDPVASLLLKPAPETAGDMVASAATGATEEIDLSKWLDDDSPSATVELEPEIYTLPSDSFDTSAFDAALMPFATGGVTADSPALYALRADLDRLRADRESVEAALTEARAAQHRAELAAEENSARARDELERRAREVEERAREEVRVERLGRDDAERRAREESERRVEAERAAREAAERRAQEEAERREAERQAREEAERLARDVEARMRAEAEAERRLREEAERVAREEAELQVAAERRAREEAERLAREAEERRKRETEERRVREEAERQRALEERRLREESERKAREEAEQKVAAERRARQEAEARAAAERVAREQAERRAREDAERRAMEAEERRTREEAERKAREAAEARAEAERLARESAERRAKDQAERIAQRAREDAERIERIAREEAARAAREAERAAKEAAAKAREEAKAERKAREDAERRVLAERKAREEAERRAKQETDRRTEAEARAAREAELRAAESPGRPRKARLKSAAVKHAGQRNAGPKPRRNTDNEAVVSGKSRKRTDVPSTPRGNGKPRPTLDEWGLYDPAKAGFGALYAKLEEIEENDGDDDAEAVEPLDQTIAPATPPTGRNPRPLSMWACRAAAEPARPPAPKPNGGAALDDFRGLVAGLNLPTAIAAVRYATGARIRRVRVSPAKREKKRDDSHVIILSRKLLKALRDEPAAPAGQ